MIDKEQFSVALGLMSDRYNRPLHPGTSRFYFDTLSAELSTEEFVIGARLAMRHLQFWPSPQQIIEYARPPRDVGLEAGNAFQSMLNLGENVPGFGRQWRRMAVAALGDPALAAFDHIGANERLRNLEAKDIAWCRREFIEAYKAKAQETLADKQIAAEMEALALPVRRRAQLTRGTPTPIGAVVSSVAAEARA